MPPKAKKEQKQETITVDNAAFAVEHWILDPDPEEPSESDSEVEILEDDVGGKKKKMTRQEMKVNVLNQLGLDEEECRCRGWWGILSGLW